MEPLQKPHRLENEPHCSCFAPIAHSSPQNLPTLRLIYQQIVAEDFGKLAQSSDKSNRMLDILAQ